MVAPELGGGALTGTSLDFAAGLGEDDGEVDEGLRMTAITDGYSSVLGAAPLLASSFPNSDEIPTVTKSTTGDPTTMGKQAMSFGIPRSGQGKRERGTVASTELKVVNGGGGASRIPVATARIEQSGARRVLLRGRGASVSVKGSNGAPFIGRGRARVRGVMAGSGDRFPLND